MSPAVTRLNRNVPGPMNSEVRISFEADTLTLEGTEELRLGFRLERSTQNAVTIAGNIFFRNVSILIGDTTGT